jgi:multidrug efflux pump subunit AcrB
VPFLVITGLAALIFRGLILTISFAIMATLAAALTLTPMLAVLVGRVKHQSGLHGTAPIRAFNRGVDRLRRFYRGLLPRLLRWRAGVVGVALAVFAGALWIGSNLGNEFLPQVDDGQVGVRLSLPPGTPPAETDAATRQLEAVLAADPHVESIFTLVGGHLGGGIVNERPGTSNIRVQLTEARDRPAMPAGLWVANMREALEALDIPGARIWVRPPAISGLHFGPGEGDFSISVVGEDLTLSRGVARQISARLQGIPGLEGVQVGREDESPLMRISVDAERAAALGLGTSEIGNAVRHAVDGAVPTRFMAGAQEYDLRVRLPRAQTADAAALSNLIVFRPGGGQVRLGDVATISLGAGPAHIERDNQSRVVRVNGEVNTAVSDVGTVMAEVEKRLAEMDLPDEIGLVFEGQWQTIQETNRELTTVVLLALFLVFVVMAVQYERISNPLVILATAPLAIIGVVLALALTGTPLSAPVMIGAILLIGIVVNNAILLVEYIEKGRRERGLSPARAVVAAGTVRLRPVLMTTATTALGMSPLAFGAGTGGEIMQPLALSVIGGLLVAMVLTLVVIPSLYLIVDGFSRGLTGMVAGRR